MKFSNSTIAALALCILGAQAAPVAEANAVAVAETEAVAVGQPSPVAAASAENTTIQGLNGLSGISSGISGLTSVSSCIQTTVNIIQFSGLPADVNQSILKEVVGLVQGMVEALGKSSDPHEINGNINNVLDKHLNNLDTIGKNTKLDKGMDTILSKVLHDVGILLKNAVGTLGAVLRNLISANMIGVVASILGGVLKTIGSLLQTL